MIINTINERNHYIMSSVAMGLSVAVVARRLGMVHQSVSRIIRQEVEAYNFRGAPPPAGHQAYADGMFYKVGRQGYTYRWEPERGEWMRSSRALVSPAALHSRGAPALIVIPRLGH